MTDEDKIQGLKQNKSSKTILPLNSLIFFLLPSSRVNSKSSTYPLLSVDVSLDELSIHPTKNNGNSMSKTRIDNTDEFLIMLTFSYLLKRMNLIPYNSLLIRLEFLF